MGCTSSAPNMANSSTAEKNIHLEDDISEDNSKDIEEIIYSAANETNVLPSCDTIPEPVHLVRNKSTPSLNNEKDKPEGEHINEVTNKVESNASIHQEKMPKLEEVVDKVFGVHTEYMKDTTPDKVPEKPSKVTETNDKHSVKEEKLEENTKDTTEKQEEEIDDDLEEALSPTQSESSRATRWEALADIAAELPPSLTVDPITGQIYSLTK